MNDPETGDGDRGVESDPERMDRIREEVRDMEEGVAPEVRPSVVSSPNFAGSKVVQVRLSGAVYEELQAAAALADRSVSDVVRAAVAQYLYSHGGGDGVPATRSRT